MAFIEVGAFALLAILGFFCFLLSGKWKILTLLSAIIFGGLALYLVSDYEVVLTTVEAVPNATTTTVETRDYSYNIETFAGSQTLNFGGVFARAEYATNSSSLLVGDVISCIDALMRKTGSPPVSTLVEVGTFDSSANIVKSFGTINVTDITTAATWQTFCLPDGEVYVIQAGDRLGVKYNAGDASNRLDVYSDNTAPFDSTATIRQDYSASWANVSTQDMTLKFYRGTNQTTEETTYTEVEQQSVLIDANSGTYFGWIFFALGILSVIIFFARALGAM